MKNVLTMLSCMLLFLISVTAQDKVYLDLNYQFKKGDQFQIKQHSTQESYLTINNLPQRTSNQRDAVLLLTVQEFTGGQATLSAVYKQINLQSNTKDQKVSVNTQADGDDVFDRLFKALINKKFTIIMHSNGTIDKISGLDAIFDQMIDAVKGVKKKERPVLKKFLKDQMGAQQLKADLSIVLPYYPDYRVRTGSSWSSHVSTEGFYHGRIDNYWKLTFGTKYTVKLQNKGKFDTDASEIVDLGGGQKGRMDLNGEMNGQYILDPKTSWPSRSIVHTELNGKYVYINPKKNKENITVPVRIVKDASYQIRHL